MRTVGSTQRVCLRSRILGLQLDWRWIGRLPEASKESLSFISLLDKVETYRVNGVAESVEVEEFPLEGGHPISSMAQFTRAIFDAKTGS